MPNLSVFKINGKKYNLPVFDFKVNYEILDGEATGRMQAQGWPMFREPQGLIVNTSMVVGIRNNSSNPDVKDLLTQLKDFGKTDFKTISFITPFGEITQQMYSPSFEIVGKYFKTESETYWGAIPIKFIAKEAYE